MSERQAKARFVMGVIDSLVSQLRLHLPFLTGLLFLVAGLAIAAWMQGRRVAAQRQSFVSWFSNLQAFSQSLDKCSDPTEMAENALAETLKTLDATYGLILWEGEAAEGVSHISARGFSARAVQELSVESMRKYLASSGKRWGNFMLIPDLGSKKLAACTFGPQFHEFVAIMKTEGLRSLLIVALATQKRTCGTLVVGRRKPEAFNPEELHVAVAIGNQVNAAMDNWSLVRERERHDKYLRTLDLVGRAMRECFDLHKQVATLRENMRDLLPGCDFALAMQHSPKRPLETAVPFERFSASGSTAGMEASWLEKEVAQTRAPLLIVENWQWARYPLSFAPGTSPIRTWCGVPIQFSDGCKGVLSVANFERERAINGQQLDLICVLANEAAGAFENARAFQREKRRARHLALLNEVGRKATSVLNTKELLPNICLQVRKAFGHDWVCIEVLDRGSDELVVQAEAGYGKELVGRRTPLGKGLSGVAAERGEPVVSNAVSNRPEYSMAPEVLSSVSLPLAYQNELLGVMTLASRREEAFSTEDVLMLKTLADQLSIALHNALVYQNVLEEAITDGLTGLKTYRYFMEALEREVGRSKRSGRPFAVIMMDLDKFKPVNDQYGHLEGDRVLRLIAKLLNDQVRQSSVLARYGGDEFSVMLPDASEEQAQRAAERLRQCVEKEPLLVQYNVTASFGIAVYPAHGTTHKQILQVADSGMYLAKHEGGNRVRVATRVPEPGQVEPWDSELPMRNP